VPPLKLSPQNHEGGGWIQVFKVQGGKFVKESEWFHAYSDLLTKQIEAD